MMKKLFCTGALLALGIAQSANAYVVNGSDFTNNQHTQSFNGNATFSAYRGGTTDANFQKKTQAGYTGVGVAGGRTAGEIDLNETIAGTFSELSHIDSMTLGLLFDGPEYGDVNEVAAVSVFNGTSWLKGTLTAISTTIAQWSFGGSTTNITATSPSSNGLGAVWTIANPFANTATNSIVFGAQQGVCGKAGGACNNQSDYTLNQLAYSAVPEPSTVALLAAGLVVLGVARRQTRKQG
jgi:hypothetical protein